jgi:hypothetical protein
MENETLIDFISLIQGFILYFNGRLIEDSNEQCVSELMKNIAIRLDSSFSEKFGINDETTFEIGMKLWIHLFKSLKEISQSIEKESIRQASLQAINSYLTTFGDGMNEYTWGGIIEIIMDLYQSSVDSFLKSRNTITNRPKDMKNTINIG